LLVEIQDRKLKIQETPFSEEEKTTQSKVFGFPKLQWS